MEESGREMTHLAHSTFAALYLLSDVVVFNETMFYDNRGKQMRERDREMAGAGGRETESEREG